MSNAVTVSDLYDYPVTLDSLEFKRATGRDLENEIEGEDRLLKVSNFLNTVHEYIFDDLIYNTGKKVWKNRIIAQYAEELEKPLKRALILQAKYMLGEGNIGLWSGITNTAGGSSDVKDVQEILQKVICPAAINALMSTEPCILYAGG